MAVGALQRIERHFEPETEKAAESVIEAFMGLKQNIMVQEYIKEAGGADIRCFVVGNQVVAAMRRQAPKGDFRSNLHRGGKASAKHPQFSAVNIMLGNLKTAITGTYHAFHFGKYAPRYLAEFQFRFNRRYRMRQMLPRILSALIKAGPSSTALLRRPEVPC